MGAGASTTNEDVDITKWSTEEVAKEVVGLGKAFEEYEQLVIANKIDGEMLATLTNKDLEEAGIAKGLHRKQIVSKVERITSIHAAIQESIAANSEAAKAALAAKTETEVKNNKLFLSYARGDESTPFARRLKAYLEEHGFDVWMDEEGIAGGVDFMGAIGKSPKRHPAGAATR